MPVTSILPNERLVRFVPYAVLRKDENGDTVDSDGHPLGVEHGAFVIRAIDDGCLSVTWAEFFAGTPDEALRCAITAFRNSGHKVGAKSGFAIAEVAKIDAFFTSQERKVRYVHDAIEGNDAHALVRRWPPGDEIELLERLAREVWNEVVLTAQLPADQEIACGRSERGNAAMAQ